MFEIARLRAGRATRLAPSGPLDDGEAVAALAAAVRECADERQFHVVIDLERVPLLNGAALEAMLDAHDLLSRLAGSLRVANAKPIVAEVMRVTGLDDVIDVVDRDGGPSRAPRRTGPSHLRIGELLVERGLVDSEKVDRALKLQSETGRRMAEILVSEGWLAERDLLGTLSEQLDVPMVRLRSGLYDPEAVNLLDSGMARRLCVMCLFKVRDTVFVATTDPQSIPTIDAVEDVTGCRVRPVLAVGDEIRDTLDEAYHQSHALTQYIGDLESDFEIVESDGAEDHAAIDDMAAGSPVINLINGLIQRSVQDGASDIHIEPSRNRCRIRMRIDGLLYNLMSPPIDVHPALVSRLKVMAKLDIAERRLPQDGRFQVVTSGRPVDLRFSSLPGIFGEKVVLRVLDRDSTILDLDRLGLQPTNLGSFKRLLHRSYGLILVTGPTGSGKTTTLYGAINHLASDEKNIVTIEDPVEYQIDGINQNQVKDSIGLGFPTFLRHVLRQDPDIVMVGEIRDRETAEIAVQAALTGHLVLSTLHTNDSVGAITRLLDMGVEPFLLSSALVGVMAQRLVRRICAECKTEYTAPADALEGYGLDAEGDLRLARGRGCTACYDSGYKDRIAIHEIIEADGPLQKLIVQNPSRDVLDAHIAKAGIATLQRDGLERVLEKSTTLEEVLRVVTS